VTRLSVEQYFERIGARAEIATVANAMVRRRGRETPPVRVNVLRDAEGPFFHVERRWSVALCVADADPADRHLLLVADHPAYGSGDRASSRFLCGHDERAWFVAAIPEAAGAKTVQGAKDALKPPEVWEAMRQFDVPPEDRDRRVTAGFIRQGEWFFLPRPEREFPAKEILRDEPIRRGEGKPHWCEELYRTGGITVMVRFDHPHGLTIEEYVKLSPRERGDWRNWRQMVRNAEVYVRGRVRHGDHATIVLLYWHRVVMNTETQALAMQHVAFLD
jgi:hypothetical protein